MVIVDTAGRLHTQTNLMDELRKVKRVIAARLEGAPHETLLVVDATTGQNGVQQARLFSEAVDVTGVALTKLDGSAKGGIAVAIAYELGIPVKLVGVGEGLDDLRPFDARRLRAGTGGAMRLEPASSFDSAFLADLFTRGYEGYFVPVHMDAAALEDVVDRWDIDLARSRVAFDGDEPSAWRTSPCAASTGGSAASA